MERFRESGQFYDISLNFTDEEVAAAITGVCKKNGIKKTCYIRPFYFVGDHGISLYVTPKSPTHVAIFAFPFGDMFDKRGISAGVSSWRKFSNMSTPPQAKMGGNYLNSIIATQEARRNGYDEAVLLDHAGNVSEASGENVFIVRHGQLVTTPLASSALEGITRDTVIRIGRDLGMDVVERDISRSELVMSDEIFLTGTAAEVTPVTKMDSKKIGNGRPGDVTKKIMQEYKDMVMGKNPAYAHWLAEVY